MKNKTAVDEKCGECKRELFGVGDIQPEYHARSCSEYYRLRSRWYGHNAQCAVNRLTWNACTCEDAWK